MAERCSNRLVALTRPRPDSLELVPEVAARGWCCLVAPLLEIVPTPHPPIEPRGIQAVIITSGNAAPALRQLPVPWPVLAVGEATATAARRVHQGEVISAGGDAAALARMIERLLDPARGALLHLAGRDVRPEPAASLRAAGFELRRTVVYRAEPVARLPDDLAQSLRSGTLGAILFFSPRTAATFQTLLGDLALEDALQVVDALCLSDAVARALGALRFRRTAIAAAPERAALLRLLDGVP